MFKYLVNKIPHHTIMVDGSPYLTRYFLDGEPIHQLGERGHVYLHHFHASDQIHELHNHPWSATSLILRGGYVEESMRIGEPIRSRVYRVGDVNHIAMDTFHRVSLLGDTWTLCRVSQRQQEWGFVNRDSGKYRQFNSQAETAALRVVDILRAETDATTVFRPERGR